MKHLLFLSFLINNSCLEAFKSAADDEEEEDDNERREGTRQGDCYDGEDNDGDGRVDCEDFGCSDKPACDWDVENSVEPSEEPVTEFTPTFIGFMAATGVNDIDSTTDKIMSMIEKPSRKGSWDVRGLVVGSVQSGKTSNFIGLINKEI